MPRHPLSLRDLPFEGNRVRLVNHGKITVERVIQHDRASNRLYALIGGVKHVVEPDGDGQQPPATARTTGQTIG